MKRLSRLIANTLKNVYFILLATVLLVLHLSTLLRWPPIFVDEAWNANRAWGYLEKGILFGTMDYDAISDLSGYESFYPKIPVFIHALIIQIAGSPDIFLLRLGSFIGGIVLLLAVYSIGTALSGHLTGAIAFLLTGASYYYFYSSHLARPDIFVAACGYWAIAIVLHSSSKQVIGNLISGLLVGIAIEIHPLGIIFGPTVLTLRVLQDGRDSLKKIGLWMMVFGLALGATFYIGLHILPNPDTFFEINRLVFAKTHSPPVLSGNILLILSSYRRLLTIIGVVITLPQIILALSCLCIIVMRSIINKQQIKILAAIILVPLLVMGLWVRIPFSYNWVLITPVIDLVIAILLPHLTWQQVKDNSWLKMYSAVFFSTLFIVYAFYVPYMHLREDNWSPYVDSLAQVQSFIRPGDRLMGDQNFWFGLYKNHFDGWEELVYYHRNTPKSTWEQALIHYHPDVFILDSRLLQFTKEDRVDDVLGLWIPKEELISALNKHGEIVATVEGMFNDEIYIYRLIWP